MLFAYLPYLYFLRTRLNSKAQRVSWLLVYFVPVFIFYYYYRQPNAIAMLLMYYIVNLVYEDGYIYNDVVTTRKESVPTLRLEPDKCRDLFFQYKKIVFIRSAFSVVALCLLFVFVATVEWTFFVGVVFLLKFTYFVYNRNRSRLNLFLILPLTYIRFYGPLVPFWIFDGNYLALFFSIFLYPLIKFLEFTRRVRFDLPKIASVIGKVDRFRVVYYFLVSLLFFMLYSYLGSVMIPLLAVSLYYFIYRSLTFLLISKCGRLSNLIKGRGVGEYR